MFRLKVRRFGKSLGVILPSDVIRRLQANDGDRLLLVEASDGGYHLTRCDPAIEDKMAKVEEIISRYRNTLHALSE